MKKQVAGLIKLLGITANELVMDITVGSYSFNSIEWIPDENKIFLHIWFDIKNDGFEFDVDFDDLSNDDQKFIYTTLAKLCLN